MLLYKLITLLLPMLVLIRSFNFRGVQLNVTDYRVRARSVYTFFFDRTVDSTSAPTPWDSHLVSIHGNITIIFPTQYVGVANYGCQSLFVDEQLVRTFRCSKIGNKIVVKNFITADTYVKRVVLTISAIVNPSVGGQTTDFQGSIGEDIAQATDSSSIYLTANQFLECSTTFNSAYGNTTAQLTISTLSINSLSTNGYFIITFPYFWTRDAGRQPFRFAPEEPCTLITPQNTAAVCTGGQDTIGYPIIKIYNAGGDIGMTINLLRVRSPPTNQPIDSIKIESFYSTDQPVDQCSVSPTGIVQRLISNLVVTPLQTPYASTPIGLSITFSLPDTLISADTIYFDFSSSYSPSFIYANITSPYPVTLFTSDSILNFTINRTLSTTQSINLRIYSIYTAPSIADVDPFTMGVELYGYLKMTGSFGIHVQVAAIQNITLVPNLLRVGASTTYYLSFIAPVSIRQSGMVRVYFPDIMEFGSNLKAYSQGIQLTLQFINNTKGVELTGFSIPPTNPVNITFTNFTNLLTTTPTTIPLEIKTYRSSSLMDEVCAGQGSSVLQFTASSTLGCQVQSSSRVTGQVGVNITFTISNNFPIQYDSTIRIVYNQISGSADWQNMGCQVNGVQENCTSNGSVINVVLNNTQVSAGSGLVLVISSYFTNPPVVKPISYFSVATFTPALYLLQYMAVPVYLTNVDEPSSLRYFVLYSRTSSINSALSTYTFTVSLLQPLLPGTNTIVLTFPSSLSLQQSSCSGCSINLPSTIIFSISSNFHVLTINNIMNSVSTQPINSIGAAVYLDSYKYAQTSQLANYIINTQTSVLHIARTNYSSYYYGQTTTINISLTGISTNIRQFLISFPKEYQIGGAGCALTGATLDTFSIVNSSLIANVTNYSSVNVTISLTNIVLPRFNQSLPILISTFTSGGYAVSSGQLPLWSPRCTLPCRTCTSTPTQCLSCFADITVSPLSIYSPFNLKCVDQCQQTQINIEQTCADCSSSCYSCSLTINNCTSCGTGNYLYGNQCLGNCPPTHYRVVLGRYCQRCQSPCETCVSSQQCLSCLSGWFYFGGVCVLSCPVDVTVSDMVDRVCIECSPLCLTCSIISTNCTSCNTNLAMEDGICVSRCSNNLYILNSACVSNCSAPCSTCFIYANYCLTCPSNYYLYANTCTPECPSMYYINTDDSCQPCTSLAIHCKYCLDSSTCQICDAGFVLFEGMCLNYTPSGYVNVGGVAELCANACVTCDTLTTNCTSCRYDYYHNGVCVTSCPDSHFMFNHTCTRCLSPCNNCLNETACLSCLPSSNKFWVSSTLSCEPTCPPSYYGNTSVFICMSCVPPCSTCQSQTSCTTCMASTYLYNSRCLTTCPHGYYQNTSTNTCTLCSYPCTSCMRDSPTTCESCALNYFYLYPNQCVSNCVSPYINNYQYMVCVNCTDPCLSCSQTTCAKCKNTHVLYNQTCVLSCPSSQYAAMMIDGTKECIQCPIQCQSCSNASFCTVCALGFYWELTQDAGSCVRICPPNRPILKQTGCEPCQDENCTACYPNNECYECLNTSILYEGFCLDQCPIGYVYNESINSCSLAPPQQKNDTVIVVPSEPNLSITIVLPIKMIFCISGGALSVLLLMLAWCSGAKVWPLLLCAWTAAEVGALTVTTYAYHLYYVYIFTPLKVYGYVMTGVLGWIMILNLFVFYYSACKVLLPDPKYRRWKKAASCGQLVTLSFIQTITLLNFKFQHFTWCGIKKAPKLESISKLKYLSVASALGLVPSIAYIVVLILLLYEAKELFFLWLDALIVLAVTAILSGVALRRSQKFFEEESEDMILHRRHVSSDQFLSSPMKGTQREQNYTPSSLEPRQKSQTSYFDTSSEISSRIELKSSSRAFLPSSHRQSLNESSSSSQQQPLSSPPSKQEVSLQCSILQLPSSLNQSAGYNTSKYQVDCEYENGSKFGVMGSMEQQKAWDGVIHEPEYYKQKYNLNDAVILDNDGKLLEMWDIESNQAVLQEQVVSSNKPHIQVPENKGNTTGSLLQMLDEVEIMVVENQNPSAILNRPTTQQEQNQKPATQQEQHDEQKNKDNHSSISVNPIIIEWTGSRVQQQNTYIHKYTSILRERLQPQVSTPNNSRSQLIHRDETQRDDKDLHSPDQSKVNIVLNTSNNISLSRVPPIDLRQQVPSQASLQQNEQNEEESEKRSEARNEQGDRFDNSLMSNHGGSLSPSSSSQYEASALSNHNGSLSSDQQSQQKQDSSVDLEQQKYQVQDISQRSERRKYTTKGQQQNSDFDPGDQDRWQLLLKVDGQSAIQGNKSQHQTPGQIEQIQDAFNNQSELKNQSKEFNKNKSQSSQQLNVGKTQVEEIKINTDPQSVELQVTNSLEPIRQQNDPNQLLEGELLTVSSKRTDQIRNTNKSSKSLKKSQPTGQLAPPNNLQGLEEYEGDSPSQEEYLDSKMETIRPKPEETNKFSIKTKRKKKEEPTHKVVVVESRKFNKLKRQASELQKQIEEGNRLKTLLDQEQVKGQEKKGRKKLKKKKQSKEEELKSIYLNRNQLQNSQKL